MMPGLLGADEAVRTAKDDLHNRVEPNKRSASTTSIISLPASLDAGIRRGSSIFKSSIFKMSSKTTSPPVSTPAQPTVPAHTRKMAMSAVVLEEWLQELAALAQEQSVMLQQEKILQCEDVDNPLHVAAV